MDEDLDHIEQISTIGAMMMRTRKITVLRSALRVSLAILMISMSTGVSLAESETAMRPSSAERARLLRRIKRAEQEGFERHNLKRHLSIFSKKAQWVFARTQEPGDHEYSHSYEQRRSVLSRRWKDSPGSKQLYFRTTQWVERGSARYIDSEVSTLYPGGEKIRRVRYKLDEERGTWRVTEVRSWPISEKIGPEFIPYEEQTWSKLDTVAERALAYDGMPFNERMRHLISAHWLNKAYALADTEIQNHPKEARGWRSRAEVGFTLGKVKKALEDAQKAYELDETIPLSAFLRTR